MRKKDGFLLVHQYGEDTDSEFQFSAIKHWRWDNKNNLLVITMCNGRVEIPREAISRVEVRYNSCIEEQLSMLERYVNEEHKDG